MAARPRKRKSSAATESPVTEKEKPLEAEEAVNIVKAEEAKPVKTEEAKPVKAEEAKPVKAKEAKPVKEEEAKPVKAETEKPAKTAEVKEPEAALVEKKPVEKTGQPVKAEEKAAEKKPLGKKDFKVNAFVEYFGKQVDQKDMVASVKKAWTRSGKRVGDIKTMDLYIKPEENAVYYVINGKDSGSVSF